MQRYHSSTRSQQHSSMYEEHNEGMMFLTTLDTIEMNSTIPVMAQTKTALG